MGLQLRCCGNGMEGVEKAAVANVKLGRLHQSLADVRVPRGHQPDHVGPAQNLEVAADHVIGHTE